ncbi:hypothetical protein [Haloarcula rubripromontorii]|uniref:hypothetical protein n=1 Tax=Haloarcula rubripromontorii TaxID=1705562 RepID=UPI00345C1F23
MSDGSDLDDVWATGEIFDDEEVLHEHWTPESVPERESEDFAGPSVVKHQRICFSKERLGREKQRLRSTFLKCSNSELINRIST